MTTTSQQWTDQSLEVAGCRLALMTAGTGAPLLILHHDIGGAGWLPFYILLYWAPRIGGAS